MSRQSDGLSVPFICFHWLFPGATYSDRDRTSWLF